MSIDLGSFIKEANKTFPELETHKFKPGTYDKELRMIVDAKGTWRHMPPDDGFDEAFFMYKENQDMSFEEICYRTRVNIRQLYAKLLGAGYNPRSEIAGIKNFDMGEEKQYEIIDNYFNKLGARNFRVV